MDGVLWDSNFAHEEAFEEIYRKFNLAPIPYSSLMGQTTRSVVQALLQNRMKSENQNLINEIIAEKQEYARKLLREMVVEETIVSNLLKLSRNYKIGLVSGSSRETVEIFLEKVPTHLFNLVVSGDDVQESKPSPRPYQLAADLLNQDPRKCLVIEDSHAGIQSAISAGMEYVHVNNGLECLLENDHVCVVNTSEAMRLIIML